jgi:hypothetical protein
MAADLISKHLPLNLHHKRALGVLGVTVVLDVILGILYGIDDHIGIWHGLYCATGTATSLGCDVLPADGAGYVLSFLMMMTILPLFSAIFSLFTTGLMTNHVDAKTEQQTTALKGHVDAKTEQQTTEIKGHIGDKQG